MNEEFITINPDSPDEVVVPNPDYVSEPETPSSDESASEGSSSPVIDVSRETASEDSSSSSEEVETPQDDTETTTDELEGTSEDSDTLPVIDAGTGLYSGSNVFSNYAGFSLSESDSADARGTSDETATGALSELKDWLGDVFYKDVEQVVTWDGYYTEWFRESTGYSYTSHQSPFSVEKTVTETVIDVQAVGAFVLVVLLFVTAVTWMKGAFFGK